MMETQNIDGVDYIPIDSVVLDIDSADIGERLSRAVDELNTKKAARQAQADEKGLTDHIKKHYGNDFKTEYELNQFIKLCQTKQYTANDSKDVLNLFKRLPKAVKRSTLSKFLRI